MPTPTPSYKWLHISDLHVGMNSQKWMWPRLKHLFLEDLERLFKLTGKWDLVIFSGDLTQRATTEEFGRLTEVLREIWDKFSALGFSPMLFVVPGNHDLTRPDSLDPEAIVLEQWWQTPQIHTDIFENSKSKFRTSTQKAFKNYLGWISKLEAEGIPLTPVTHGLLPGDASCTISANGITISVVGLNSAWLQLSDRDFKGKLHVDPRQLLAITQDDADKWCKSHDFNLLVTHHPSNWLHPESLASWNSEINPLGRFDAHLFGHMHEPNLIAISQGGGEPKIEIQAASLFGLEKVRGFSNRIHGYTVASLCKTSTEITLRSWPRRTHTLTDGAMEIDADRSFRIDADQSFAQIRPTKNSGAEEALTSADALIATSNDLKLVDSEKLQHLLQKTAAYLAAADAHLNVRKIEQNLCKHSVSENRCAWLVADWGMGENGFIWALQHAASTAIKHTYKLDLERYSGRDHFLDKAREYLGCSFEQYCELLSGQGASYLILTDIPIGEGSFKEGDLEREIEEIVSAILQYCPNVVVLMLARRKPALSSSSVVELLPLDEADTRAFIEAHPLGGKTLSSTNVSSQLYRHTDGVPGRIESALKELEVVSLSELLSTNSDVMVAEPTGATPYSIVRAIAELSNNPDRILQRTFALLKTLSMFPQGAQLDHIKRFLGVHPFLPSHARELLERGLVDAVPVMNVGIVSNEEVAKSLVVRRPVRDYVRFLMTPEEQNSINRMAVQLYFGEQWINGVFKMPHSLTFSDPQRGVGEITNATVIIVRVMKAATEGQAEERKVKEAFALALFYSATLWTGTHYRGLVSLYEDLTPHLPESGFETERIALRLNYAKGLRMLTGVESATEIFSELAKSKISKAMRLSVLVNLALCHEHDGNNEDAASVAKEIIKLDPKSNEAVQAETILLEGAKDDPNRFTKLAALERNARSKGSATVAANNIAMSLASALDPADINGVRKLLEPVLVSGVQNGDSYNLVRARLKIANATLASNTEISQIEKRALMGAYQYLHNQRLDGMFESCHSVLWHAFQKDGEENNLLRLFRHSSLIWRLRGKSKLEISYVQKLANAFGRKISQNLRLADKETAYFLARTHLAIDNGKTGIANKK